MSCFVLVGLLWSIQCMLFSLYKSFSLWFTANTFFLCWSFLATIFNTDTPHEWVFNFSANWIMSSAMISGCRLVGNELVRTWIYTWFGFCFVVVERYHNHLHVLRCFHWEWILSYLYFLGFFCFLEHKDSCHCLGLKYFQQYCYFCNRCSY